MVKDLPKRFDLNGNIIHRILFTDLRSEELTCYNLVKEQKS